ncbi:MULTISPECIES: flavocytochrome c [unclassified Paenibacillus]|uniref:flavocytochrome c n=1 Tax=unclassified Paenibacillus TaxID=185978 RepID=UPI00240674D4|nr:MULTISPECIES: flavocytochrome c [unclassified Paenibacillus]MDF9844256.1 fumarate reductase flavoprotein subunit [Paenibacillus sp. PastF-2]MDF9850860.1 fumarate reductase flavoprotein subunit [Paenibacillus sp. PastM-2]MDF9857376.1 fumarate reductase flavoprotein subunit [Paenibacillus sp. PastF-1]MDH6482644.1 fumarate reductase flavoprotein subunit [Paenibacillus sp. PastH-2]MDH6510125.1 fumarate reductase flavoprotein subunit [Paenibacillus sp. PastM-3]
MKKKTAAALLLILSVILVIAGCGNGNNSTNTENNASGNKSTNSAASATEAPKEAEAVSGASVASYTPLDQLKESYDIIIVGAGGAGMTAALEAKAKGLSPVIFEKMPVAGGNTTKSSSGMNASETKFQKEQGIEDSNDLFYEETLKGGHDTNNTEMLRFFVDNSAAAIDWLDSIGIRLNNITITGGMNEKRTHRPEDGSAIGQYLVKGLVQNVQEQGIPLFVNADVKEITQQDGKVSGVKVLFNQADEKAIAGKAVVVTTGGFGSNMDMITEVRPDLEGYVTTNQIGSTGDGIKMILAMGGTTVDMDQIQVHPTVQQEKSYLIGEAVRGEGGLLVSSEGTRFTNELDTRDKVTAAINGLPEKAAYLVFDSGVKSRVKAIEQYEKMGFVLQGDSVQALAEAMQVPADKLQKTVDTWNSAVASKQDAEFGRTTGMDNDLSAAPFYAIKIAPGIHYTMGGVKINTNTEVLNKDGQQIPGLFAAGEVTGGLHGQNRIGGNSVAEIIIFGRQAGIKSAEFVQAQ